MSDLEDRAYEIKNTGCTLAFAWALIAFFGGIFLVAQIVLISRGYTSFAELLPWLILDSFIVLFCFLTFRTDRVSLAVDPAYIKIGRSKIEWFKIKEILIYKSSRRMIVSNHIMSKREVFLIDLAYNFPIIILVISILGFISGVKRIDMLDSEREFEKIVSLVKSYCKTFNIDLTEHV
ncbi:MAG: hypothetical protein IKP06_02160 [Elusimicrobiaceae bacterium]|nr:hypothetical protein [Elusimicrobiaceae bacterium]